MLNVIKITLQIGLLYIFYLIGTYIQTTFNLLIPGSVIGLILLFCLLTTKLLKIDFIEDGARFFVNHLVLFFIPPTVGIMNYFHVFTGKGLWLVLITMISTILVIGISGFVTQFIYKRNVEK